MKKIIILLLAVAALYPVLSSFKSFDGEKIVEGYIIDKDGARETVNFILEKKAILVTEKSKYDISDYQMANRPKYMTNLGKKLKLGTDVKEYGFEYAGDKFTYHRISMDINSLFGKMADGAAYGKLIIDGKCKLYYYFKPDETRMGTKIITTDYVIVKEGAKSYVVNNSYAGAVVQKTQNGGTTFEEYFSDCESLQQKLKGKEFKDDKYSEAVNYYNSSCAK